MTRGLQTLAPLDRISGGPGEEAAARYITAELDRFGVPYQVHRPRLYLSWPVRASLRVEALSIEAITASFSASTPALGVTAKLAYVKREAGHLFTDPESGIYGLDVRGKIVMVDGLVSPQSVVRAATAGAVGVIHLNPSDLLHEMIVSPVWGTPTPADADRLPKIPVVSVRKRDAARLLAAAERGAAATLQAEVSTGWRETPLVVAEVKGQSDEFVLLSAHLDAWYSGMSDTGAANVALLEFARLLHGARDRLSRSIRVAWWTGHSTGRYGGSAWYADRFWPDLDQRCVGFVNLDGPGTKGVPLDVVSTWAWPELMSFVDAVAREVSGREPVHEYVSEDPGRIRPPRAGDSSFQGIGVPEFSVGVPELAAGHPDRLPYVGGSQGAWWWHTRDDTIDKVDVNVMIRDLEWRLASLLGILNARVLPYRISAIANAYTKALGELDDLRLDLKPLLALARRLRDVAERVERRYVDEPDLVGAEQAVKVNRALLRASHGLNAALYTAAGRFAQDPATPMPLLPSLDGVRELRTMDPRSDRYGFLLTELIRGRNRVEAALGDGLDSLDGLISSTLARSESGKLRGRY